VAGFAKGMKVNSPKKVKFLCKGASVRRGEIISSRNDHTGESIIYRVERVWGSHVVCIEVEHNKSSAVCKQVSLEPDP
jgi:hypothetical protein